MEDIDIIKAQQKVIDQLSKRISSAERKMELATIVSYIGVILLIAYILLKHEVKL